MTRRSLLSALILLGGTVLIAIGWWDYWNPDQINRWLAGEWLYPYYWNRLALTLGATLPAALLAWWLGVRARISYDDTFQANPRHMAAWGFALALAIPLILLFKYRVTWLGMNYGSSVWIYALILVLSGLVTWLGWPALRNRRLPGWLERQGPMVVLTVILVYVVVYGGLAIARHTSFRTEALGLGTIDQAMWNTSAGRLLEYTPIPGNGEGAAPGLLPSSRLADGTLELIYLPLSLFYWLWADPRLLIVLQVIIGAGGAIPLYQLARSQLEDEIASLAISLAYLLYLPLHTSVLAGFQASALMVPFVLWAWQAAGQGRWRSYYLAAGIALLCRVDAALALLGIGVYFLLKGSPRPGIKPQRRHGAVSLLLGLAWLALDFRLVTPWAQAIYGSGTRDLLLERYASFGRDIPGIGWGLITHPLDGLRAMLDRERLQALVDLIAPLGWTPLLAPLALLPTLPILAFHLLTLPPHFEATIADSFISLVPFLFIAALQAASSLGRWISRISKREEEPGLSPIEGSRVATLFILVATLLTTLVFSGLPPGLDFQLARYYQAGEHEEALARTLALVPADAIVSAQTSLFPHLSRRRVIYRYPTVADAEYVVLDLNYNADKAPLDEGLFYPTVDGLLADPAFHVAAFDDGALLLRRGPGQPPPAFTEALANYRAGLYRSAIVEFRGATQLQADNLYQTQVVLENRGSQSWETGGMYPIYLSYHWWTSDGTLAEWNGLLTPLEPAVNPNDVRIQGVLLVTPSEPGDYILEWDLVHQYRAWFGDRGGITLRVGVTVE